MCGIFGYLGLNSAIPIVLSGLKKLEYRGYDSAGVAFIDDGRLLDRKSVGRVSSLKEKIAAGSVSGVAIGHTRWATHGEPTERNAHPHFDTARTCAVVHNGIIENFEVLRRQLTSEGMTFHSDTDTEVIAQLVAKYYDGDIEKAFHRTLEKLSGSFACVLLHKDHPDKLLCVAKDSPLAIGVGDSGVFISSDARSFSEYVNTATFLSSGEIAVVRIGGFVAYDASMSCIEKSFRPIDFVDEASYSKGDYEYHMLKEIYEQPEIFLNLVNKYVSLNEETGLFSISSDFLSGIDLTQFNSIHIVACGSSYHAGCVAKYVFESFAKIPVRVEIASEFRYRDPYVDQNSLAILISQSGETADTLAALKEFRKREIPFILGICNVPESSLVLAVDKCIFLEAGIEVGVASTKAFSSQLLLLMLLGVALAEARGVQSASIIDLVLRDFQSLSSKCAYILQDSSIQSVVRRYSHHNSFLFLGRRLMYPIALEAALKSKEIAYVYAEAHPAGELKHGPIALANENLPIVAFCADLSVYEKTISSIMEVKARRSPVIAIASESSSDVAAVVDSLILVPDSHALSSPILCTIVLQLMTYFLALEKGTEVDYPRNLAKSVTVE
ncbi:glutamine--fructose-6-phosphate transaminase (isomerizing) [Chlamydiifrater volucris]|uniref:glutamine--fructose-6-phosphate transaminase (isomerizing) n=1 Tax=Chlamydiifrater volucris TaxID=2681470 RepID=UPI001BD00E23|nr:glutamine--fructose-6-phosphate transaminase (isomerizing) [Chlamydiifrater volucris]